MSCAGPEHTKVRATMWGNRELFSIFQNLVMVMVMLVIVMTVIVRR